MTKQKNPNCGENILSLFQKLRSAVYDAFSENETHTTRTQQMILTALNGGKALSMSEVARLISTSNEQATRAVSQLVALGFIERSQNESNHRIVNIRLTPKARTFLKEIRTAATAKVEEQITTGDKPDKKQIDRVFDLIKELDTTLTSNNE